MSRLLSDKGLKIRVSRTKEEKENMPEAKSTDIGYVNKNNQRNNGITPHEEQTIISIFMRWSV